MAQVPSDQNLIRDITELLKARGLRIAAHSDATDAGGALISDSFQVYAHTIGASSLTAPTAGNARIVIDFSVADLTALDEKGFGSLHPHVPSTTRQ